VQLRDAGPFCFPLEVQRSSKTGALDETAVLVTRLERAEPLLSALKRRPGKTTVCGALQRGQSRSLVGHCAVPGQVLGSVYRPCEGTARPAGDTETWALDDPPLVGALRAACPAVYHVQQVHGRATRPLRSMRVASRGADLGEVASRVLPPKHQGLKGKYFAGFFSGRGGVAVAARRLAFPAREFELRRGPQSDFTNPKVIRSLFADARIGKVLGAMLAPLCGTFSVARDRTSVIRNRH
jgi:hypothetical protein